jgi:phosphatidylglycerophosphatase A
MNWDETVAFLGVLVVTGDSWLWGAIGFGLFRFFDIVKPPPVGTADRHVKGGLGVMLDDALAALCTVVVLWLLQGSGWFG